MDARLGRPAGETSAHQRLKQRAFLWAQAQGFTACAMEVTLPRCRYRADVVAYRASGAVGLTAIFECKQTRCDLRRDNCCSSVTRSRLETVCRRRQILEKHLRVHYPNLRISDSLFPEFDSHDFAAIRHRGYTQVLREIDALQNRLYDCTKFERLIRYGCANFFFLVLTEELFDETEIPVGWGALVESADSLVLTRKPAFREVPDHHSLGILRRIAAAGTRSFMRQFAAAEHDSSQTTAEVQLGAGASSDRYL